MKKVTADDVSAYKILSDHKFPRGGDGAVELKSFPDAVVACTIVLAVELGKISTALGEISELLKEKKNGVSE
jgi:hypothetical protein